MARRRATFSSAIDLAIHRRVRVPESWLHQNHHEPASSYLYDWIASQMALSPGMSLIDVGCGFGAGIARFARVAGVTGIGITDSPIQAELGGRFLDQSEISLEVASFDEPLQGLFDAAIAVESLVHARSLERTIENIAMVLRPRGVVGIVDDYWATTSSPSSVLRTGWGISELRTVERLISTLELFGFVAEEPIDLTSEVIQLPPAAVRLGQPLVRAMHACVPSWRVLARFYAAQLELHRCMAAGQLRYVFVVARKAG